MKSALKRTAASAFAITMAAGGVSVATVTTAAPANASYAYYGAIALSPNTGGYGRSWDYTSEGAARRAAMNSCGYADCRVTVSFVNGCGALAKSPRWWGSGAADDLRTAQRLALGKAPGGRIVSWVCTSGHQ